MIRVFVGEDTFRSRAAYQSAKADAQRTGPLQVLRDEGVAEEHLAAALAGQPLFGFPPAVAIENLTAILGERVDVVLRLLARVPPERCVLIWERGTPNERSKLWKALRERADHLETFSPLSEAAVERWVEEAVRARGGAMTRPTVRALVAACGLNLWTLDSEIEKLLLYAQGRHITPEDVVHVTPVVAEANVFATVRALATGDGTTALRHLAAHRASGDDPRIVLSATIREVRTLLTIRDLLDRSQRVSPWGLARDLRLPVAVVSALLGAAQRTTVVHLRALFDRLVVALYALNTGRAEPDDILDSVALQALPLPPRVRHSAPSRAPSGSLRFRTVSVEALQTTHGIRKP
jgi:DNA polymerase III delta subunit